MRIKIAGTIYEAHHVKFYGYLPAIETKDGPDFYLALDSASAGEAARKYWEDMANDSPEELADILGAKCLIGWGLGLWYGGAKSLMEWLDLKEGAPAQMFATVDGKELEVNVCGRLLEDELGFVPTVAYEP
jgi:hypothetical protein